MLAPEILKRIGEPFFQSRRTGTGSFPSAARCLRITVAAFLSVRWTAEAGFHFELPPPMSLTDPVASPSPIPVVYVVDDDPVARKSVSFLVGILDVEVCPPGIHQNLSWPPTGQACPIA